MKINDKPPLFTKGDGITVAKLFGVLLGGIIGVAVALAINVGIAYLAVDLIGGVDLTLREAVGVAVLLSITNRGAELKAKRAS